MTERPVHEHLFDEMLANVAAMRAIWHEAAHLPRDTRLVVLAIGLASCLEAQLKKNVEMALHMPVEFFRRQHDEQN